MVPTIFGACGAGGDTAQTARTGLHASPCFFPSSTLAAPSGHAVDSILGQTFTDFELVVVDDGSTDGTAEELARGTADDRLRVLRHERNLGLVEALNHGLSICAGDLIARLDADDLAFPTRLERQVAEFDAHPGLVLCGSPYERWAADGGLVRTGAPPQSHAGLAVAMLLGNRVLHSTAMYRRDAAISVGGYDTAWFPVEDYDLWLRLLEVGEFHSLETSEVRYTVNPCGISARRQQEQGDRSLLRSQHYLEDLVGEASSCAVPSNPEPSRRRAGRGRYVDACNGEESTSAILIVMPSV